MDRSFYVRFRFRVHEASKLTILHLLFAVRLARPGSIWKRMHEVSVTRTQAQVQLNALRSTAAHNQTRARAWYTRPIRNVSPRAGRIQQISVFAREQNLT